MATTRPARRRAREHASWLALLAFILVATPLRAEDAAPPALDDADVARLRSAIAPTPEEEAWRAVGWRPSLAVAVEEARASGRPLFLWAMNGHPLACT